MKRNSVVFMLIGLLLISCPGKEESGPVETPGFPESIFDETPNEARQKIDGFLRNGFLDPIGNSIDEIIAKLGEPLKRYVLDRQNMHDPAKVDQIHEFYYDGLFLRIYHVTDSGKDIIVLINVTGEKFKVLYDLAIGSAKQKVSGLFGKPDEETSNMLRYFAGEYIFGSIEFLFQNDQLTAITWNYFID